MTDSDINDQPAAETTRAEPRRVVAKAERDPFPIVSER